MLKRLLKHVALRNVLLLYLVQFSSYVMPLITLPYLSRVLSPEKFGLIAYAQAFMWYFITLTDYGFNLSATRQIAIHQQDTEEVSRIFSTVMVCKVLLTLLGLIILMTTVLAIPKLRPDWLLFLLAFLSVVGNCLFPLWLFQGLQKLGHAAIRDFLAKIVGIVALLSLVHSDKDYLLVAGIQGGSAALAGLIGLACVPLACPVLRWRTPGWRQIRQALVTGWPLYLSLAASSFAGVTNIMLLGLFSTPAEVGYYSGAQRIVGALKSLLGPVVTAVYPMVSLRAGRSKLEALSFVRKYAFLLSSPFLVMGILVMTAGPWIVRVALGAKYDPSIILMQIMAMSPFLVALSHVYSTYYMLACGYDRAWMRIMLMASILNFVLLFPLLYLVRGSLALTIAGVAIEVISLLLYWNFYRKNAPRDMLAVTAA